ncbi:MAG: stage II sporulation protein M [Pseudomonadota bacterium]
MKQKQFEADNAALWTEIENILHGSQTDVRTLPSLYRRLCQCLALSRQRGYSPALAEHLQKMVGDCHRLLYGAALERPNTLLHWLGVEFPCRVRAEWRLLLFAFLAFFGVALAIGLLIWYEPTWAYSFTTPQKLAEYRKMYQPGLAKVGRGSEGDMLMFGHYIWNNVSICFRSFAAGIFGGIPALFSIAMNGMHLGVIGAWLSRDPVTSEAFWSFVITHASFEITGLLLCGMAGMRLGLSLVNPGRLSRGHALRHASLQMFPVLVGGALMTFLAAFIEGFWSASPLISANVKYAVGALCWSGVILFFLFAGRGRQ